MNPLNGRIRMAFDSDQGRELMDGLTLQEKQRLMNSLLTLDLYEVTTREEFYAGLSKDDRKLYRRMTHAGLDFEFIQFFLSESKKHKLVDFVKKFFHRKDVVRINTNETEAEFKKSRCMIM